MVIRKENDEELAAAGGGLVPARVAAGVTPDRRGTAAGDDRRHAAARSRGGGDSLGELALVSRVRVAADADVGPSALHLDLSLAEWAADGLLAVFFFVAGLELKQEFITGDLRDPRRAAVPVAAAVGGVIAPALTYLAFTADGGAARGWAIPSATDIAFALAALAVAGRHLPAALRTFLLTLAVVDDLLAIVIIAVSYTSGLSVTPLLAALAPLALFAVLVRRPFRPWWLLLPLATATWALVHASGVHATVAGVLLAFTVPAAHRPDGETPAAEHFEHRLRPVSAGLAVPAFALLSAGVSLSGLPAALSDPVALGVIAGLAAGKAAGITAATWLTARFTRATLDEDLSWADVAGVAMLGGIGFTVSLLISELAFGAGSERDSHAKAAILAGSLTAALLASIVLRLRNRAYRRIEAAETSETADGDDDRIPGASRPRTTAVTRPPAPGTAKHRQREPSA